LERGKSGAGGTYRVVVAERAEKDLARIPAKEVPRIIRKIDSLPENPRGRGKRKIIGAEDLWRARVGDWRVIYEIDDAEYVISVLRVRHRREAYRKAD
jgi:mRNA interferase RelE/StbE